MYFTSVRINFNLSKKLKLICFPIFLHIGNINKLLLLIFKKVQSKKKHNNDINTYNNDINTYIYVSKRMIQMTPLIDQKYLFILILLKTK